MKFHTENLSKVEALALLNSPETALDDLLMRAYAIRKKYKGNMVGIQLLTNARSGDCSQNCSYCAQSQNATANIQKYNLISQEKLLADGYVVRDKKLARHCIGLSGIRFSDAEINAFAEQVRVLKTYAHTEICCSIGFLTPSQALVLKDAGVNRINHNLNTSRNYYPKICTTHTYQERINNIKMLQSLGLEICCGGIIGLGESNGDVVDMLFAIQEINPHSVPINFLIPMKGTALETQDTSRLSAEYCLKVLCLARILIPEADIRCAAGREVYLRGREKEMFCAVDSIFASGYLTADGQAIEDTIKTITAAGFEYYIELD